jgi:ribosomal protein S18 acetylase RimI-like enzyme
MGQARARRESGAFSCRNAVVCVIEDAVVACLIGYPLEVTPVAGDHSGLPPMFVPLQELEDLVPGTWYINVLATRPEYRGRGYGTELLALAESIGRDRGMQGLSLIVADSNLGARRLYGRHGYLEIAQRPMVKEDWQSAGTNWVLMRKDAAPR